MHAMRVLTSTIGLVALFSSSCCHVAALPPAPVQPPSYNYTFKELRSQQNSKGSFQQPYFRFNIFFRKSAVITEEFFHSHWKTVHADLTISEKDGGLRLLRYTQVSRHLQARIMYTNQRQQFHQDQAQRQNIQPLLEATGGLLAVAPYDGIAEFLTKDYQTFEKFIMQIFLNPIMIADQQSFVDASTAMHVMAGYDNLIFGDAIDASKGKDGILPNDSRLVRS